jgi:hypothetical protein
MNERVRAVRIERRSFRPALLVVVAVGFCTCAFTRTGAALADNFVDAYYDAKTDQLVVTIRYRGTNPNHKFSLQWGACRELPDGSGKEIVADVIDSQASDVEHDDFKTMRRFHLTSQRCRPATVTLRTAPRFFYTLQIPARNLFTP